MSFPPDVTVVFIPGHLSDARLYAPQIAALRTLVGDRFRYCIADVTRDDSIAGAARRLLDATAGRLVLLGLSMGGMVAMVALGLAPERILGAVLLDTDPAPARDKEIAWRAEQVAAVENGGLAAFVDPFVAGFFRHDPKAAATHAQAVRAMMLDADIAIFRRQAHALDTRPDLSPTLAAFDGPVLVIWGAEDKICPPLLHHRIIDAAQRPTRLEIPGAGHLTTLEAPDAVSCAIGDWMATLSMTP